MILTPKPGDRITFLDFDAIERTGIVIAVVADVSGCNVGFPGFICIESISEQIRWGYLSQIIEINGVESVA